MFNRIDEFEKRRRTVLIPRSAQTIDYWRIIFRLQTLRAGLVLAKGSSLNFKVSEKGGLSVYGLGRFPVALYLEQWVALLSHAAELRELIEAND